MSSTNSPSIYPFRVNVNYAFICYATSNLCQWLLARAARDVLLVQPAAIE
jgi:hypothetical protein